MDRVWKGPGSHLRPLLQNSNPMLKERVMTIFPRSTVLDEIRELAKALTSTDHIFEIIANQDLKFLQEVP